MAAGRAALERALEHQDRYARDRAREALAMARLTTGEPDPPAGPAVTPVWPEPAAAPAVAGAA
jgi:hypothetical protein